MREIREIVKAYTKACSNNKLTALATVVKVEGSAYRRPGARMLITEDGELTGAISGGCLEGDALKKALFVIRANKAKLVKYDTSDDEGSVLGVGLGCNGIIYILIEPINESKADNPIALLQRFLSKRQSGVLSTLVNLHDRSAEQPGTCLFLTETESLVNSTIPAEVEHLILRDSLQSLIRQSSTFNTYIQNSKEHSYQAFIEFLSQPFILNIAGAGNDVIPLVKMASMLGWNVRVFDGRPNLLTQARFPDASELVVARPEEISKHTIPDAHSGFVLMTHNYQYDFKVLKEILKLDYKYIGVLGPKKKLDSLLDELKKSGFNNEDFGSVFGPAGLDLGAETAEEVALSIISEVKAVLSGTSGMHLRLKDGPIHSASLPEATIILQRGERNLSVC